MLLEVYKYVQLNRCSVICGCVLQRGQRGEGVFCRGDWTDVSELGSEWDGESEGGED